MRLVLHAIDAFLLGPESGVMCIFKPESVAFSTRRIPCIDQTCAGIISVLLQAPQQPPTAPCALLEPSPARLVSVPIPARLAPVWCVLVLGDSL